MLIPRVFEDSDKLAPAPVPLAEHRRRMQRRWNAYYATAEEDVREMLELRNPRTHELIQVINMAYYPCVVDQRAGELEIPTLRFKLAGEELSDENKTRVEEMLRKANFREKLKTLGLFLEMFRTVGCFFSWHSKRNHVVCQLLPPMRCDVLLDDEGLFSEDITHFVVYTQKSESREEAVVWTRETWQRYTNGTESSEQRQNPYGELPVHFVHASDEGAEFWRSGGDTLYDMCIMLLYHWSDVMFCQEYQGHGQPVFTGLAKEDAESRVLSPAHGLALNEGQNFRYETPGDASSTRLDAIRQMEETLTLLHNLPADSFDRTLAPASGAAKEIAYAKLMSYRTSMAERLADNCQALFDKLVLIHNTHTPFAERIPEGIEIQINLEEWKQRIAPDPEQTQLREERQIKLGIISPVDIIVRERGISPEEAEKVYQKNKSLYGDQGQKPAKPGISLREVLNGAGNDARAAEQADRPTAPGDE